MISLIFIACNHDVRLDAALAAISGADRAKEMQLVVVYDGDHAQPRPVQHAFADSRLVTSGGRGRAAARNAGAAAADGDFLIFLDGDMLADPRLIDAHIAAQAATPGLVRGGVRELLGAAIVDDLTQGGAGFPPLNLDTLARDGFRATGYRTGRSLLEQAIEARFLENDGLLPRWIASAGPNFSLPRAIWTALNGQDEGFGTVWGCEDLEFSYRVWSSKRPITYAPDALAYHLSHVQPARWDNHAVNLARFQGTANDPAVDMLDRLLAPDGSVARYRAALAGQRQTP